VSIVTRFAPSPTGFLHIGGARTALFNYLYARRHGGKFLLRIEDTDKKRSTESAIAAILDGLRWLDLDWDGDVVFQSSRAERHREAAMSLLNSGRAYWCYASREELESMREAARAAGRPMRYDGRWRNRDSAKAPEGVRPVLRLKAEQEGETSIDDAVQGRVTVNNDQLDDLVLLRSDGSPTYMLAVVIDDADMEITHVIRGDDHLNNSFRQLQILRALDLDPPQYAHIPLIHGPDGSKLSKRHGALGVGAYREMGYLPEAVENCLLRLGWGHGDAEIINRSEAVQWFDLATVGRSAARFDIKKLDNLNGHYIRAAENTDLARLLQPSVEKSLAFALSDEQFSMLQCVMTEAKIRAKDLNSLADSVLFYFQSRPLDIDDKALNTLKGKKEILKVVAARLESASQWTKEALEDELRSQAKVMALSLGKIAQPLRAVLTGAVVSPGIFDVMEQLGREESLGRINDWLQRPDAT